MTQMCQIILSYLDILFLLCALTGMTIIFIKTNNKVTKIKWGGKALVIPLLLMASIINLFLLFTVDIQSSYDVNLITAISEFIALMASIAFMALIVGKKRLVKML